MSEISEIRRLRRLIGVLEISGQIQLAPLCLRYALQPIGEIYQGGGAFGRQLLGKLERVGIVLVADLVGHTLKELLGILTMDEVIRLTDMLRGQRLSLLGQNQSRMLPSSIGPPI